LALAPIRAACPGSNRELTRLSPTIHCEADVFHSRTSKAKFTQAKGQGCLFQPCIYKRQIHLLLAQSWISNSKQEHSEVVNWRPSNAYRCIAVSQGPKGKTKGWGNSIWLGHRNTQNSNLKSSCFWGYQFSFGKGTFSTAYVRYKERYIQDWKIRGG
jgi:hypothetical protein